MKTPILLLLGSCSSLLTNQQANSQCFCQLTGYLDDCTCRIEELDNYNNKIIYPQLYQILQRNYFRYYKANTSRPCKFWDRTWQCKYDKGGCVVESCPLDSVPMGLKGEVNNSKVEPKSEKAPLIGCQAESNATKEMDQINRTISTRAEEEFEKWKKHDQNTEFCDIEDENDDQLVFIDLLKNPERFTGYDGKQAWRVWRAIYDENCFKPEPWPAASSAVSHSFLEEGGEGEPPINTQLDSETAGLCLEKRIFYRAISGLHSSINLHLSYIYRYPTHFGDVQWKPNLAEFRRRFDHEAGGQYLKNLYFLYLLEMRAFAKAAPYLSQLSYYTGDSDEDGFIQETVKGFLKKTEDFPMQFDESLLFQDERAENLKNEFRIRFKNVTSIIDCASCEKCRLWGKLQTQGLGTALKILFTPPGITDYDLQRNEVVALFNGFGRLSHSIVFLENFQKMAIEAGETPVRKTKSPFSFKPEL